MKKINWKSLLINLLIPLLLGSIVGLISSDNSEYLNTLNRHIIIPNIVFPIVWTFLYLLVGFWAYLYEETYCFDNNTIGLYYLSLGVNLSFIPVLFLLHLKIFALVIVIFLLLLVLVLFYKSYKRKKSFRIYINSLSVVDYIRTYTND